MKKCTLILMAILTITACKKEKVDSTTVNTETNTGDPTLSSNCITLEDYYKISDSGTDAKAKWLRERGDSVCKDTLEKAVLKIHQVKGKITNQKAKYSISWKQLKDIIKNHGYDAYLSVVVDKKDKQKIIEVKMVPEYSTKSYCFSTALIRALAKKHAKDDSTEFEFSFANLIEDSKNQQTVIVIQVKGNSAEGTPYYDYSTDPGGVPTNNKPI